MISKSQVKLIRQLEQKKYRKREGLFVAEGPKVVGDLLRAGHTPHALFATADFPSEWCGCGCPLTSVTAEELCRISFLQHPQQVLALFPIPSYGVEEPVALTTADGDELVIALDGIQDPGNLGTIIRIADWFGICTIFCSPDTADAWSPKVVQSTMGSIARVRIVYTPLCDLLDNTALPVYGTLLDGEDIYRYPLTKGGIIVMGNEGNGISADIRRRITRPLLIPSFHPGDSAESLNVAIATAITCSEFRRRQ